MVDYSNRTIVKIVGLPSEYTDGRSTSTRLCYFRLKDFEKSQAENPHKMAAMVHNGEIALFTGDMTAFLIEDGQPWQITFSRPVPAPAPQVTCETKPVQPAEKIVLETKPVAPAKPSGRTIGLKIGRIFGR